MGFKVRGYNKEPNMDKTRDYSLFAIACEGTEREPEYFRPFNGIDRIKVDIIENESGHRDSAPKKILERVKSYIEEVGLSEKDNDTLWCVIDVDRWPREQIEELADFCNQSPYCNLLISNPCFEIWLLYHKLQSLEKVDCSKSQKVKEALHELEKGGYYYLNYLPLMQDAIRNSECNDSNPKYYYPNIKETKVYILGKSLMEKMGKVRFEKFINEYLPKIRVKNNTNITKSR